MESLICIGGNFVTTNSELPVYCSHSGNMVGTTYLAGSTELENAIELAEKAIPLMKKLPSHKKFEALNQISNKIKERKQMLATILSGEASKPMKYALSEIDRAAQVFLIAAEESKRIPAEYMSIDWTPAGEGKEAWIKYFPLGLIAGIAPFNFPLNLSAHKIAPALASGNCIILKPARSTPLTVLELAKIIYETDLPKGCLSVLPMDRVAGNQLVTDHRFKMLTFTGSSTVGWKMKEQAGNKKIALELGGNAGVVISDSANVELAINKCITGAFAFSGQVCIHTQRIYVQEKVFDTFLEKFVNATTKLKIGSPEMSDTDISAMIDEENAIRVEQWVNEAVEKGAKIMCGGKRNQAFFEPTVLTQTQSEMKVCCQEIFGPVVIVEPYKNFNEVIEQVNNTEFGLQAGIFTDRISEMNFAFENIEAGGVIINDVSSFRVDHMPYGGVKNSGLGREGVKYAMFEMMEPKLLVKNLL